ncbi:MAG: extracellular solute-binding protein [Treponema sp.]|jgi:putative aldouronate transport system substrate-binding protein|nr:extracellular solute-binding protein [Treponema sp.]
MKKIMAILVGLAMAVSVFAGGNRAQQSSSSGTSRVGAKGSLPLALNKPVLTMFVPGVISDVVTSLDYKDNAFTKKIVDETGVQLEITATSGADAVERLNVMLNAGTYPDIICARYASIDMNYYASQGILIPMDDYDIMSYPNIKAAFDEFPAINEKVRGTDGKLYALPWVNDCLHCTYNAGRVWYFLPWIRDNGLKAPETTDELAEYLRYVKNHDLNGNGKNDELGIVFGKNDLQNFITYITKAFMPFVKTDSYFGLALDNSRKIVEQYRDDNFRAALSYLAGLYKEGLIAEDAFSMTADQLAAVARNAEPITAVLGATWVNNVTLQPSDRYMDFFYLPPLKTASGQRYASSRDPWGIIGPMYYITDKCKDPELAIALYNYLVDIEVSRNASEGPKGIAWNDPDPGALSFTGGPALYKRLVNLGTQPVNASWNGYSPWIGNTKFRLGQQVEGAEMAKKYLATGDKSLKAPLLANASYPEFMWYVTATEASKYAMPQSLFIPPFLMNTADNTRVADINAVLNPFKEQAIVEFITGIRDINNNAAWNAYLAELDRLNSKEAVSIMQKYVK